MVQPGPLFSNMEVIDAKYTRLVAESLMEKFSPLLCQRCGYPNCLCRACGQTVQEVHSNSQHQCWLKEYGAHPLTKHSDPITSNRVSKDWQVYRNAAWDQVHKLPTQVKVVWDGKRKAYFLDMQDGIKRRKQAQEEASEDEAGEAKEKGGETAGAEAGQAPKEAEGPGQQQENQGEDEEQAAAAERR